MLQCLENIPYKNTLDPEVASAILGCIGIKPTKELLQKIKNDKNGGYDMCKALRDMIDDGITIGKLSALFDLVKDNIIPLSIAAERASTTEEHFLELVEQYRLNN